MEQKAERKRIFPFTADELEMITRLAMTGATDPEIAMVIKLVPADFREYVKNQPELQNALREGRDFANANVAKSLYRRAIGYECTQEKVVLVGKDKTPEVVQFTERYPPDTLAGIYWLNNRSERNWKNRGVADRSMGVTNNILITDSTKEESARRVAFAMRLAKETVDKAAVGEEERIQELLSGEDDELSMAMNGATGLLRDASRDGDS